MTSAPPLAAILTLGCKLNLADSEEIARGLRARGFEVVDRLCEANAYVVNTCSVTHVADRKSRKLVRSIRRMAPAASVAVTGCYPQTTAAEDVRALGADLVTGTLDANKDELVAFLASHHGPAASKEESATFAPAGCLHGRAFIKAQEGCNDVCAFCIVPRTRGKERSRPPLAIVRAVNAAVATGAREVVITGTQLGAWGRDLASPLHPYQLLTTLLERTDVARLRLSSLQPQDITPDLLALWSDPRLMPHFHLALQSGSDHVLAAMRRRYDSRMFRDAAARIRAASPDAAITTDVIAGFPGETDDDFEDTLRLCREVGFARIHAFPYSRREGTGAARMPSHIAPSVRRERMARLLALGDELAAAFRQRFAGSVRPVLWEDERETPMGRRWHGYTDNYIPVIAEGHELASRVTAARLIAQSPDDDAVLAQPLCLEVAR